ncbi:MAG: 50S ribosomal protein L25 [Ignavibacteriae bacterium HGW-Ignavibacteriae-2]|jgi:large subunit ribosomal protein L25|nr:50S ribosomal protein L25 [Bacteroidota bacterium]PKL89800.1 MAG: 50S ribosomal protein L25 [Ignavibacteriae bacterium HGW-Ignavibacteriae-2]
MAEKSLIANKREISTKGAINQMRKAGIVPGVYYAKGQEPIAFSVSEIALKPLIYTAETHIINLVVDDKEPVKGVVKAVQFDPVTDRVVHFDIQGVTMGESIGLQVPILIVGTAPGVKEGGLFQQYLHKLDVECLPRFIPENLEINISGLNLGDSIHVRDLSFENITIVNSEDTAVVAVETIRGGDIEEESDSEEITEPEVIGKGKSEEED